MPFAIGLSASAPPFPQETRTEHLVGQNILDVAVTPAAVYARTSTVTLKLTNNHWQPATFTFPARSPIPTPPTNLPWDELTAAAPGWFGTTRGAIRVITAPGPRFEYRAGRRWLPHDHVNAVAAAPGGSAWIATRNGLSYIHYRPMAFAEKARFYEDEIDRRHRRTPYGYVRAVTLARPGDKSEWTQHDSDNDGLWTAMYGAGECFAYAATQDPAAARRAKAAFEALRFLGVVTQGGSHPAPPGYVARTILPSSGPNPNLTHYTRARDEQTRATRDPLWKILWPRWPTSADGQWYWKADTSSDELDGHYFFYAQYYDLVADDAEKRRVREHVAALTTHLVDHNFTLVDWDGKPTRWGIFNPEALNADHEWWEERGLNSLSILSYLKVAGHITGDAKYARAAGRLIREHHYAQNTLIPKTAFGPGAGNQSDDEMAFMNYYNLLKYEKDPGLRRICNQSLEQWWTLEQPERNPLFNFIYAAATGREGPWLEDALDTLRRFPLELINWRHTNSHRKDVTPLAAYAGSRGVPRGSPVLPIDERYVEHWNHDPWALDTGGDGRILADGATFLLPYWLGLHHRFVR